MARQPSEYTTAIRNLLNQHNGELTHAQIRPLLKDLGFEIAAEPPQKSDAFDKFNAFEVDMNDPASIQSVMAACEFDAATQKVVLAEAQTRVAFKTESNNFNVIKHQWGKNRDSALPSPSRKPTSSKNTKAQMAAVTGRRAGTLPVPKHRRPLATDVSSSINEALEFVTQHGGVTSAQSRIDALRAEADELENAVTAVVEFRERLASAA